MRSYQPRVQDSHVGDGDDIPSEVERLYRDEGDRMWRALLAFAGDPEVASDAVAEAFAQALRRGDAIRDPARWVWRTAFRIAAGMLKERRMMEPEQDVGLSYEMDLPARELIEALRQLSPRQRASVVLHHAAGYPVREVAAILGSTPAAVKVHLMRGRDRLRRSLGDPR
jgi:RNA polymerase sigma-70 factor (ECF subfamily)